MISRYQNIKASLAHNVISGTHGTLCTNLEMIDQFEWINSTIDQFKLIKSTIELACAPRLIAMI